MDFSEDSNGIRGNLLFKSILQYAVADLRVFQGSTEHSGGQWVGGFLEPGLGILKQPEEKENARYLLRSVSTLPNQRTSKTKDWIWIWICLVFSLYPQKGYIG